MTVAVALRGSPIVWIRTRHPALDAELNPFQDP